MGSSLTSPDFKRIVPVLDGLTAIALYIITPSTLSSITVVIKGDDVPQ